jgi:uncharacterized protein (DUF58 family)
MRPLKGFYAVFGVGFCYFIISFLLNKPGFFFAGMLLWLCLLPSLFDLSIKRALVKRTVRREFLRTKLFADQTLEGKVRVRGLFYPDVFELEDSFDPPEVKSTLLLLPGWYDKKYELRLKRGKFKVGLRARLRDRFGLFEDLVQIQEPQDLTVHPSYEDVRKLEIRGKSRQLGKLYGPHRTRQSGLGGDFRAIRDYFPTDEFRKISWKHLARYGKLMSREYEAEKNLTLLFCLDSSWTMSGGMEPVTKLEYSIRACMLLARVAEERGDSYGMVVFSEKVSKFLKPGRGRTQFYRLLDLLSEVRAGGKKSYTELANFVCRSSRRSMLLLLLTDLEEADMEELRDAVRKLRGRGHQLILVCPFTPRFEVQPQPSEVLSSVQASLLEEMENAYRRTETELGKMGVDCVKVGPQDFIPRVMEAVLEKKRLGAGIV